MLEAELAQRRRARKEARGLAGVVPVRRGRPGIGPPLLGTDALAVRVTRILVLVEPEVGVVVDDVRGTAQVMVWAIINGGAQPQETDETQKTGNSPLEEKMGTGTSSADARGKGASPRFSHRAFSSARRAFSSDGSSSRARSR